MNEKEMLEMILTALKKPEKLPPNTIAVIYGVIFGRSRM